MLWTNKAIPKSTGPKVSRYLKSHFMFRLTFSKTSCDYR